MIKKTKKINSKIYSFKKFINKFIDYQPLYPNRIGEPKDHLGLAIVEFPKVNNKQLHIEYGEDGRIYCEILDYTTYKEGEVIPLGENIIRHVIVNYVTIKNDKDAEEVACRINEELHNMFNIDRSDDAKHYTLRELVNVLHYQNLMLKNYVEDISQRLDDLDSDRVYQNDKAQKVQTNRSRSRNCR